MAKKNFNFIPLSPKKDKYSAQEWSLREDEYVQCLNSIVIPMDPDDLDICNINAMIDQVYSIARIEQGINKRWYEKIYRQKKLSETEVYIIVKNNLPKDSNGNPIKKTETEMKALGSQFLQNNKLSGNMSIYQMLDLIEERLVFMDSVIDILKQKSDKLITDSGALKLAIQISGNTQAISNTNNNNNNSGGRNA